MGMIKISEKNHMTCYNLSHKVWAVTIHIYLFLWLSKLSPTDQRRIVNQIITGKLDNAVQATNYMNIIQKPVCPQTVRNALKRNHLKAVVKAKKTIAQGQAQCYDVTPSQLQ